MEALLNQPFNYNNIWIQAYMKCIEQAEKENKNNRNKTLKLHKIIFIHDSPFQQFYSHSDMITDNFSTLHEPALALAALFARAVCT